MHFRKKHGTTGDAKVEIQMTPMLDMIFQLLIFFILTFRPVMQEGQFDVKMSSVAGGSQAGPSAGLSDPLQEVIESQPPVPIILRADANGRLAAGGIVMGGRVFDEMRQLQRSLEQLAGESPDDVEISLQADTSLHYEYVMQAVNAISHSGIKVLSFAPPAAETP